MKRTGSIILAIGLCLAAQTAQADWTGAKRLTWTSGVSELPVICVDASGHLHVVWQDDVPGNKEIYYLRSTDGGATWGGGKRLTLTSGNSSEPDMAVDASGTLYLVWSDNTPVNHEIYHKKSTDGGVSWTASQRLTWTSDDSVHPDIAIDSSGYLHVVWCDYAPGNFEIYHKRSTDGGSAWTTSRRLTWTQGQSLPLAMAYDTSGSLQVVWRDNLPGAENSEIFHKKSTDGGVAWSTSKRLTWTLSYSDYPAIAGDSSGNLHVVWQDFTPGTAEIYYKNSGDGGTTWSTSKRLTWAGNSGGPDMATDSSANLHVVWHHYTPVTAEIYYKNSGDWGATWTTGQRLTWTSAWSLWPDIAVGITGDLHVVWQDYTPGNYEVYYKKFINN